ncbi:MAG: biotin--[acetyl-CoA-carboxylase] ligase [Phycisphaerae bacterium]|nr:biotin--[acetyl-CoA-carboxylase] ligase [Phycisphaerae bacterium]
MDPKRAVEPVEIEWFEEVESTQLVARGRVERGLSAARGFAARVQTSGYGRHGRVWQSPAGGLWMTLALPDVADESIASAGVRVGAACGRVVEELVGGGRVRIKWPNDVLVDGGKVCGVLCESVLHGGRRWLLVGIGMNVNNGAATLTGHLRRAAVALCELTGGEVDLKRLAERVASEVRGSLLGEAWRSELEWAAARLWKLDERVVVLGGDGSRGSALVRGLSDGGGLVVEMDGRRRVLDGGSVIESWDERGGHGAESGGEP